MRAPVLFAYIFRLCLEDYEQKNLSLHFAFKEPPKNSFKLVLAIGQHCLSNIATYIPFLDRSAIIATRDSRVLNWIGDVSSWITNVAKPLLGTQSSPWSQGMTPENVKAGFVSALKVLKEDALKNHDINITFAILSVPDFFNETVKVLVKEACRRVGVEIIKPFPMTVMGAWGAKTAPDARILKLGWAIKRARLLMKDNLDILVGKTAEGYHHEEWPLDLMDWWIGEEQNAVLSWNDVEVVEQEYVEVLGCAIFKFLVFLRMIKEHSEDEESTALEDIDVVTCHVDADILKRTVNKALEREVEILGGAVSEIMFAADGAAITAFKLLELWQKAQRYRQRVEEFKHNEL